MKTANYWIVVTRNGIVIAQIGGGNSGDALANAADPFAARFDVDRAHAAVYGGLR